MLEEVTLMVDMEAIPARADDVASVLARLAVESRAESGCDLYEVGVSAREPLRFRLFERWQSRQAFKAHKSSEHLDSALKELESMLAMSPVYSSWNRIE